jgi:putative ABC transport system permease protein
VVLGIVGAVVGTLVAIAIAWAFNRMGFAWTPPGRVELIPLAVRVASEPRMVLVCAAGLVAVAAVSAALPAARAARLNIVDALRHA